MNTPIDVIEQIAGKPEEWDQVDALSFVVYNSTKFEGKDVNINFESGLVEILNEDGTKVEKTFAIEVKLHEIDNIDYK